MRRITDIFEERLVAELRAQLREDEWDTIDYDLGPAPYPAPQPDGSQGVNMGMGVSLSMKSLALNDHVMITGLVQDPYAPDEILKINVGELLRAVRQKKALSGQVGNGSGLIIPGRMS